jgi:uncharacterized protein YukE
LAGTVSAYSASKTTERTVEGDVETVTDFFADPDRLRAVSPHFAKLGADVESALERLKQGITAEGKCWGSDAPGKQFEATYPQTGDGSIQSTLDMLKTFAQALQQTGDNITRVANSVQSQDDTNAAQIRKV